MTSWQTWGSLTCGKPGQDIEKELVSITKEFIKQGEYTVFAIDLHEEEETAYILNRIAFHRIILAVQWVETYMGR